MSSAQESAVKPKNESGSQGWSLTRLLGIEDCCVIQLNPAPASAKADEQQVSPPSNNNPPISTMGTPQTADKKEPSLGIFAGLAKQVTDAIAKRAAAAENDKKAENLEKHVSLLKVWLSLVIEEDNTSAQVEWRSPQLIMNQPMWRRSIALDQVRTVRIGTDADDGAFPKGGAGIKKDACVVIASESLKVAFEFTADKDKAAWLEALQFVVANLLPQLHENLQKKLQDERRLKEIEERKQSRDARRAQYAAGGMTYTARIMSGM